MTSQCTYDKTSSLLADWRMLGKVAAAGQVKRVWGRGRPGPVQFVVTSHKSLLLITTASPPQSSPLGRTIVFSPWLHLLCAPCCTPVLSPWSHLSTLPLVTPRCSPLGHTWDIRLNKTMPIPKMSLIRIFFFLNCEYAHTQQWTHLQLWTFVHKQQWTCI